MSYGTSTHAQRLAWQWDETHPLDAEPSLAEQFEQQDTEFRHWDQYTFQLHARGQQAAGIGARERGAASSSDDDGGAPTNVPRSVRVSPAPCMADVTGHSEAGGIAGPPGALSLASSVERWMWAA